MRLPSFPLDISTSIISVNQQAIQAVTFSVRRAIVEMCLTVRQNQDGSPVF